MVTMTKTFSFVHSNNKCPLFVALNIYKTMLSENKHTAFTKHAIYNGAGGLI